MSVYFAEAIATGEVKIGFSSEPWHRVRSLSRGGKRCRLLATIRTNGTRKHRADDFALEQETHLRFSEHRVSGEWFAPVDEVLLAAAVAYARSGGDTDAHKLPTREADRLKRRAWHRDWVRDRSRWIIDALANGDMRRIPHAMRYR